MKLTELVPGPKARKRVCSMLAKTFGIHLTDDVDVPAGVVDKIRLVMKRLAIQKRGSSSRERFHDASGKPFSR